MAPTDQVIDELQNAESIELLRKKLMDASFSMPIPPKIAHTNAVRLPPRLPPPPPPPIEASMTDPNMLNGAYCSALSRSLSHNAVTFLRYLFVDACNNIQCHNVPMDCLIRQHTMESSGPIDEDGGSRSQVIRPDLSTLRFLPYAPQTAVVMGMLYDHDIDQPSSHCTRNVLRNVLESVYTNGGLKFVSYEKCACWSLSRW